MASILTVSEIIELGQASTYLSANYVSKQGLFGGTVIKPTPPNQIAWVTDALRFGYDGGAQTDASLRSTANYLYWLCGKFQLEAQQIINGDGGGSVTPTPAGGSLVNPLDWEVGSTATSIAPLAENETSVLLDGTNGMPDLRGYNIEFTRGNLTQYTTAPPDGISTYYSWNRVTGLFTVLAATFPFGAAQLGEQFRIYPSR